MWPSIELISVAAGTHRETTRKALEEAAARSFLMRERQERFGPGFRYSYFAAVPDEWQWMTLESLREWERDKKYASERGKEKDKCPRAQQGHVPAESGDKPEVVQTPDVPALGGSVPAIDGICPRLQQDMSPLLAEDVPAESGLTKAGILVGTNSYTNPSTSAPSLDSTAQQHRAGELKKLILDKENPPLKSPSRESKKALYMDYESINNRVEKLFVDFSMRGVELNAKDPAEIARMSGLTERQVAISIQQLTDRGRLPIKRRATA